ncbi:hypothetical protein [Agathobacter rectalis]|uniref:hypothetical protein n=1 Tax=Agathobacter rectalis TaxID=39491 RepID=UPI0013143EF2|nr:hypothetical protein [Agathobacter rectalis]
MPRYCRNYAHEAQKCPAKDGWARRYAPWTAHKSRFRQAKKPCKHNFVQNLGSVA